MDASWSILVIDDDPSVRQSLPLCLEAEGARVLGVGSLRWAGLKPELRANDRDTHAAKALERLQALSDLESVSVK